MILLVPYLICRYIITLYPNTALTTEWTECWDSKNEPLHFKLKQSSQVLFVSFQSPTTTIIKWQMPLVVKAVGNESAAWTQTHRLSELHIKVNTATALHGLRAWFSLSCVLTFKMDVLTKSAEWNKIIMLRVNNTWIDMSVSGTGAAGREILTTLSYLQKPGKNKIRTHSFAFLLLRWSWEPQRHAEHYCDWAACSFSDDKSMGDISWGREEHFGGWFHTQKLEMLAYHGFG